jgi:hypothetical protein
MHKLTLDFIKPMSRFFNIPFISLLFVFFISACNEPAKPLETDLINNPKSAGESNKQQNTPAIEFARLEYDFGRLIQGEKATYTFKYKNTGTADLILSKVSTSCGCTASSFTTTPVKPGGEGKVEIVFDSNGLRGIQNKTVTVLSNTSPSATVLRLKAQVALP